MPAFNQKESTIGRILSAAMLSAALFIPMAAHAFDGELPPSSNQLSAPIFNILPFGEEEPLIKTQVLRKGLMHPIDYWWYTDPSMSGKWDYTSPVAHAEEPVEVLTMQTALVRPPRPQLPQIYNYPSYNVQVSPTFNGAPAQNSAMYGSAPMPSYNGVEPIKNTNGHINTWLNGSIPVRYVSMVETRAHRQTATIYR
ncbi:hypothetical protein Mmc1_2348 [Magnetococcus marinus MC-1]|uniref:Uncharacterized protein n=1 Tax=Magnetococcus marinus (strain ATCC BAA-1437 / JCM 17883 / MC-1) TaxID=156889 RepID=A0LA55_MAGMM|nr:hypothetical protein [Magnetococcus marinus]ABK44848.1 hypothetical protein Mmc1_2348 [Magnetococcus marinus MC-1]